MIRVPIDPVSPDAEAIAMAADAIRAGRIVAIPTDTLYGLAADPFNVDAVARVYQLKGRGSDRALPLVAADIDQIEATLGVLPVLARRLAVRYWPGPLTMLMPAPERLPAEVTGGTGRVGVRVPAHAVARALCAACATPLTATSANKSGVPATNAPDTIVETFAVGIDTLLDAGITPGGLPSTIVDVTDATPRVVREGAVSWESIQACLDL